MFEETIQRDKVCLLIWPHNARVCAWDYKKASTVGYFIILLKLDCIYLIQCGPTVCTVSYVSFVANPTNDSTIFYLWLYKAYREFCRFTKLTLTSLGTGLHILWKCWIVKSSTCEQASKCTAQILNVPDREASRGLGDATTSIKGRFVGKTTVKQKNAFGGQIDLKWLLTLTYKIVKYYS